MHWWILALGAATLLTLTSGTPSPENDTSKLAPQIAVQADQNRRLAELQQQWQAERHEFQQQRDQLEAERRDLAAARIREPILASTITQIGILLAGVIPLLLGWQLLAKADTRDDATAVAELLVTDLVSPKPQFFAPALPHAATSVEKRLAAASITNPNPET